MTYIFNIPNFIISKNEFIPNKNYGWRDKLKKRRRLLINVTHASTLNASVFHRIHISLN